MTNKATATMGYTKRTVHDGYYTKAVKGCVGIDFSAIDGLGNKIEVMVREGDIGYRVVVNGETIATTIA